MKDIYLISYAVKGIKNLDDWAELSFYKKTITKGFDIKNYNIKGIYGVNGAGKSAIIASVRILRSLLIDDSYLNNPLVQNQLAGLVHKKLGCLLFDISFLAIWDSTLILYRYQIELQKNSFGRFVITKESLSSKNALSHSDSYSEIFRTVEGVLSVSKADSDLATQLVEHTKNLLTSTSFASIAISNIIKIKYEQVLTLPIFNDLLHLSLFGYSFYVYLEDGDEHINYIVQDMLNRSGGYSENGAFEALTDHLNRMKSLRAFQFSTDKILVNKKEFAKFQEEVKQLCDFLQIFKSGLLSVDIDKTEDKEDYLCNLLMNYGTYSVDAEFESTGIKKLIRLFIYFKHAVDGDIVFIDELDSNLHDVYLCAVLEYLMEHAKGQLCFTTHNIGPMDVLKGNKKSIDFLSVDHKIYSWTKNGNYSPAKLYKNGMIEGSPFNVDSIDFIRAFPLEVEE